MIEANQEIVYDILTGKTMPRFVWQASVIALKIQEAAEASEFLTCPSIDIITRIVIGVLATQ